MRDAEAVAAADLFGRLTPTEAHLEWSPAPLAMTRDFADPDACELCRAGWCVQRLVVRPGGVATIVHGLAVH